MTDTRRAPITSGQKNLLTEYIKKHPQLQSGLFSNQFTKKDAQKLWEAITITLNAVPGASEKTWKQWRKTWQDLKKHVKAKNSELNKYQRATGGGPPSKIKFTDTEQEILSLQVPTSLSGCAEVQESATIFYFENDIDSPKDTRHDFVPEGENENRNKTPNIAIEIDPSLLKPLQPSFESEVATDEQELQVISLQDEVQPEADAIANPETARKAQVTPMKKRFTTKSARLDKSLTLTKDLLQSSKSHNVSLENYYKSKIAIMQKNYDSKIEYRAKKIACLEKKNEIQGNIATALNSLLRKKF